MKKQNTNKGLMMTGSFRKAGVTFYQRNGQTIARVSRSRERRSNTLGQFAQRQRIRHHVALWQMLTWCKPMFTRHKTAYQGFMSLASGLPVVYVPKVGPTSDASLLMPGIPVSDGTLPEVKQHLGEHAGTAALLTDLKAGSLKRNEKLLLYTAEQRVEENTPRVRFTVREISRGEMAEVDGHLALMGDEYADDMRGWALVRTDGDKCSTQSLVTRCTYYLPFTTADALQEAARSYGGLTE